MRLMLDGKPIEYNGELVTFKRKVSRFDLDGANHEVNGFKYVSKKEEDEIRKSLNFY